MARWVRDERLNQPSDFVRFIMEDYLNKSQIILNDKPNKIRRLI